MQIAPIGQQGRLTGETAGIALGHQLARAIQQRHRQVAGFRNAQPVQDQAELTFLEPHRIRKALHRHAGLQPESTLALVGRIAPAVLPFQAEPELFARAAQCRQDRLVERRRARNDLDDRLFRQFDIVVGGNGVDQNAEFESLLAKGLQTDAGAALAAVAEPDDDLVALAQEPAHHLDIEGLVPRPDVALHVVFDMQDRPVRRFHRRVVRGRRIIELRTPHIRGEAMHDLDRSGIVDAEITGRIGHGEFLVRPCFEAPCRGDRRASHSFGHVCGMRHQTLPLLCANSTPGPRRNDADSH